MRNFSIVNNSHIVVTPSLPRLYDVSITKEHVFSLYYTDAYFQCNGDRISNNALLNNP